MTPPTRDKSAAEKATARSPERRSSTRRNLRIAVVGLAVVVALIAWIATRGDDSGESAAVDEAAAVQVLAPGELGDAVAEIDQPVYWAGPADGTELELEQLGEGGVRVRYVPEGSEPGETSGEVRTIGSYPLPDPEGSLDEFTERPGAIVRKADDGTKVVTSRERPTSVYFVDPGNTVQIEVYDPDPEKAMSLARSGEVQPAE